MNNPIRRLTWLPKGYPKSFVGFWEDGSLLYRRIFWRLYTVTATFDCTTTGGGLYYVDPITTGKL